MMSKNLVGLMIASSKASRAAQMHRNTIRFAYWRETGVRSNAGALARSVPMAEASGTVMTAIAAGGINSSIRLNILLK